MRTNFSFDKKGFLFFLKFTIFIFALFGLTQISSQKLTQSLLAQPNQNIAQVNQQIVEIKQQRESRRLLLAEQERIKKESKIILGFVGDIMLDRGIESVVMNKAKGNFFYPFELIQNHLQEYDLLFGNLEGPISDKGFDQGSIYSFRMDVAVADVLRVVGFDVLSVANNHLGDWGMSALEDTLARLAQADIIYSGGGLNEVEAYSHKIINVKGLKIAFLSFSQFGKGYLEAKNENSGISIITDDKVKIGIEQAKQESDLVVVSLHFGAEYATEPNLYQRTISENAIKWGADLVVGHHPHTPQPVEQYQTGHIAYSLGNFIFDQNFSEDTGRGLILRVIIQDKKIIQVEKLPVGFTQTFQPFLIAR